MKKLQIIQARQSEINNADKPDKPPIFQKKDVPILNFNTKNE